MVYLNTIGRKIDFVGNCIAESTEYFFVLSSIWVFVNWLKSKFLKKNSLIWKKILEGRFPIFHRLLMIYLWNFHQVLTQIKKILSKLFKVILQLRSKNKRNLRNSLDLVGVALIWHVAHWVSRAPPYHTLPVLLNLADTSKN